MRWLVCCVLLPLSASAASVLLVPQDEKARVLADELIEPFGAAKLTVKMAGPGSPAVTCLSDAAAREACLQNIEEKAKVVAVFVVTGAFKGAKGTLTLEMLSKGAVLKKDSFKVTKGKVKTQLRGPIANLLKLLPKSEPTTPSEQPKMTVTQTQKDPEPDPEPLPVLERQPEPKVSDVPKKTEPVALAPTTTADPLSLKATPPKASKPKVAAWVVTGLAVAAAGTAATFAGLGFAGKGQLEKTEGGVSTISYNDAVALRDASNAQLTVALGTGIGAGVAGVVAGILWGVE